MNPLGILRQFVKGLTSDTDPRQIGWGIAIGFVLGLIPKGNLTAQLLLVLLLALKVNIPMGLITMFLVSFINPLADKLTDPLGYALLTADALAPLWTRLYNMPVVPWTDFNNTVLLGGLIAGAALFFPVFLAGRRFGVFYNDKFRDRVMNSRLVKSLKASFLFDWYFKGEV